MIKGLILFALIFSSTLFAAQKESCYSIQLASYLQKNEHYINSIQYPKECKRLSFGNTKAVRCGCYETKEQAKEKLLTFKKKYTGPIIVRTSKFRFKRARLLNKPAQEIKEEPLVLNSENRKNPETKKPKEKLTKTGFSQTKNDSFLVTDEDADYHGYEDIPTKLKIQYFIYESEIGVQGHVDLITQSYPTRLEGKHKANLTLSGDLAIDFKKDEFSAYAKVHAQGDYYDTKGSSEHNQRSFLRLDEFYGSYDFENDQIMFGKNIRFWGALEVRNITDGFNNQDLRSDPFKTDKLGAWNAAYTHYTETGEISVIVKLYEEDRKLSAFPYVYYPFGPVDIPYNESIRTEESNTRPSVYLKYSGSTDSEYPLDYAIIFENGYDSQRYYTVNTNGVISENAYLVNKLMTYNTLVVGSTLVKVEAVYANVMDGKVLDKNAVNVSNPTQEPKEVGDYYHLGLGVEHTLSQFYNDADLGLLAEYYRYDTFQSGKRDDLDLFEVFQNDIFLGFRYSFNEGNDASIVSGAILDLDYNEEVYYIEYESRIADTFKLKLDYRFIDPSSKESTAFAKMGRHQRISANLGYYF